LCGRSKGYYFKSVEGRQLWIGSENALTLWSLNRASIWSRTIFVNGSVLYPISLSMLIRTIWFMYFLQT
jgi:hypothetical protein